MRSVSAENVLERFPDRFNRQFVNLLEKIYQYCEYNYLSFIESISQADLPARALECPIRIEQHQKYRKSLVMNISVFQVTL